MIVSVSYVIWYILLNKHIKYFLFQQYIFGNYQFLFCYLCDCRVLLESIIKSFITTTKNPKSLVSNCFRNWALVVYACNPSTQEGRCVWGLWVWGQLEYIQTLWEQQEQQDQTNSSGDNRLEEAQQTQGCFSADPRLTRLRLKLVEMNSVEIAVIWSVFAFQWPHCSWKRWQWDGPRSHCHFRLCTASFFQRCCLQSDWI